MFERYLEDIMLGKIMNTIHIHIFVVVFNLKQFYFNFFLLHIFFYFVWTYIIKFDKHFIILTVLNNISQTPPGHPFISSGTQPPRLTKCLHVPRLDRRPKDTVRYVCVHNPQYANDLSGSDGRPERTGNHEIIPSAGSGPGRMDGVTT